MSVMYAVAACIGLACVAGVAYAQTDAQQSYTIHVPDMMIRGETYRGVIVAALPADEDTSFRFGAGSGDVILPDHATIPYGANHALFDIIPVDSTILSGRVATEITVIQPDGIISDIPVETHPGIGTVSRLWMVGPGAGGVVCDAPADTSADAVAARAAEGVFDTPSPDKEIRTRLSHTTVHVFLADRYCTPVTAPPGGVSFTVSSDTPALTFGNGRTHLTGVIPQGYNSAVLDVSVNGAGILYATGTGVAPDSILVEGEPAGVELHLGIGPSLAMESSYVTWYLWLERNGVRYVPDGPLPVYLTTDNPALASFEQSLVDSSGPAFADIRPHHAFMVDGAASGVIHTGTPAVVGDLRLLAGDRRITVSAHIPGYGSASATFQVGMPGATGSEFQVQTDRLRECMEEESSLPDGFYSQACTDMWHRLLVASHFFDIKDAHAEPLDTADDTISFLNSLFGGDNTDSGTALYELVSRLNEYSISDEATGGLSGDLTDLLERYLQTSDITIQPTRDFGLTAELLERMPDDPPPNRLFVEAYPGVPGVMHVVVSTLYEDDTILLPLYLPDGIITLSGDWGIDHEVEVKTYGSNPRPEAPGTRPTAVDIPVGVAADGVLTASLGGVGSHTIQLDHLPVDGGKQLHVSTLPGSGMRDLVAIISVLDSDGLVTTHDGPIYVEAGQGASDVEISGWRGGGGMVRGMVDGVGEIVIHAPGLGGGTALTTPVRHETALDVWYPDVVHVAEEFPLTAHTLDSGGLPVRLVQVEVAGSVDEAGAGLALTAHGVTPIVVEYGGLFHTGEMEGFLNEADVSVRVSTDGVVELLDTVVVDVDTGVMRDPDVSVSGGPLLFSGERPRWEALADDAGQHTISVTVSKPGWVDYTQTWDLKVSHLLDIEYDAATMYGVRADADLDICGETVPAGGLHRMEPGVCNVSVPNSIRIGEVSYRLDALDVDGRVLQPGAAYNFAENAKIVASYEGVVAVEVVAFMPDGSSEELLWDEYAPGDTVRVVAEPRYEMWGLIWDRPAQWSGLPNDAAVLGGAVQWEVAGNESVTIRYERDITYLVVLGAAGLSIPAVFMMRRRIPGLRFR